MYYLLSADSDFCIISNLVNNTMNYVPLYPTYKGAEFQKFNILIRFQEYIIDILFIYSSFLLPGLVISIVNYMET